MREKHVVELDAELFRKADAFGKAHGKPVSRLLEDYIAVLGGSSAEEGEELPPITARISGALKGTQVTAEDYYRHLEDKYLGDS